VADLEGPDVAVFVGGWFILGAAGLVVWELFS
jgi:hypothetical protein